MRPILLHSQGQQWNWRKICRNQTHHPDNHMKLIFIFVFCKWVLPILFLEKWRISLNVHRKNEQFLTRVIRDDDHLCRDDRCICCVFISNFFFHHIILQLKVRVKFQLKVHCINEIRFFFANGDGHQCYCYLMRWKRSKLKKRDQFSVKKRQIRNCCTCT